MTAVELTPQLIGQTEKTMNAILDRLLAGTGISEPQWVALTITVRAGGEVPADELAARVAGALKAGPDAGRARLGELAAAGLVHTTADGSVAATELGAGRFADVRARTAGVVQRLWGDLPPADLAVTAGVLQTVLGRAEDILAA